jgi:DNA-binding response OmpR family regulator
MHIIIVDAFDDYLQMLREYLRRHLPSATITCVHSAEAALTAYAFGGADLVITAHRLPRRSGVELVQELRRQTHLLPIIMNTAVPEVEK